MVTRLQRLGGTLRQLDDRLLAAAAAALTVALGWVRAGDHHFWLDEAYTAASVDRSFGGVVRLLGHEAGMGPYYLGLWAWNLVGDSEWWLRMFSVAGGACTVAAAFLLAARLAGRRAALITLPALWCNPFFLYYLTELRAYSWVMFAAVVSTSLFLRFREQPSTANAVRYGLAIGLMLNLLVFSVGIVVAHLAFTRPLVRDRAHRRLLAITLAVGATAFAPAVPALLSSEQLSWIPATTRSLVGSSITGLLGGSTWRVFLTVGVLAAFVSLVRRSDGPRSAGVAVTVVATATVPTCLLLMSLVQPLFLSRYLAPMFPMVVVAAAIGYVRATEAASTRPAVRVAAALVVSAVCIAGFRGSLGTDEPRPEDVASPSRFLRDHVAPDDAVVVESELLATAVGYYWPMPQGTRLVIEHITAAPAPGDTELEGFCRVWYLARTDTAGMAGAIALPDGTPGVEYHQYLGYTVASVDTCPTG